MDAPRKPSTADEFRAVARDLKRRGLFRASADTPLCWCARCTIAIAVRCGRCDVLMCGTCSTEVEKLLQACEPCLTRYLAQQLS